MQRVELDGGRAWVDPAARQLVIGGAPAKLGGRAFDLLMTLVAHRDRVVAKHELMDLVWPGLVVEENNLQVQVMALRKLLGNAAIATVSGRGYRFTLPVEAAAEVADQAAAAATRAPVTAPEHDGGATPSGPALIGREALLAQVGALLAEPGTRWLTLLGAGGSGKTRLALAAAAQRAPACADGSWTVMLAAVRDPDRVLPEVAAALGLQEAAAQSVADQLRDFLRHRQVLLVLDNLEHVLPQAGGALMALLRAGPGVQVLATSRLALSAAGEHTLEVPPLALAPEEHELADARMAAQAPAVALFARRAGEIGKPLRDHADAWRAAAAICRRLDGLPLAIELAAARLRTLTPEALAARLQQSLRLLRGDHGLPERQQTLRATIAWSHELLAPDVQRLYRRLGVFAGGWSLEAAEALDETGVDGGGDTIDRLDALLAHHLVQRLDDDDEQPRYGMLEMIREHALECLEQAGETAAIRQRHARTMAALVRGEEAELLSARRPAALRRLALERGNLREALRFAGAWPAVEGTALWSALVSRLGWWWYFDDGLREGERWTAPLLERLANGGGADAGAAASGDESRCWITGARLAFYRGAIPLAQQLSARAVERATEGSDAEALAHALLIRALAINPTSREEADHTMARSLEAFRALAEPWGLALGTQYRGVLLYFQPGAADSAERYLVEGAKRFEALGDPWGAGGTAAYLGFLAMSRGDLEMAERHAMTNLSVARAAGDRFREGSGLQMLARIALARGQPDVTIARARENVALQVDRGSLDSAAEVARWLAFVHWRQGDHDQAARLLGACGPQGPPTPFALLLGPERAAEVAQVMNELPAQMPPARWQALSAEGEVLGLERLLGLVAGAAGSGKRDA